jgi:hypothetical protein
MSDDEADLYGAAPSAAAAAPAVAAAVDAPAADSASAPAASAAAAAAAAAGDEEEVEEESSYDDDDDLEIVLEAVAKPKEIVIRADGMIDTRKDVWRNPVVVAKPKSSRLTYVRPGQAVEGDNDEDIWRRATGAAASTDGTIAPREKTEEEKMADEERGNGVSAFDCVLAEEGDDSGKPWREDGQDVSDYFNYGLTEATWKPYSVQQLLVRRKRRLGSLAPTPAAAPAAKVRAVAIAAAFQPAALSGGLKQHLQQQQQMQMQQQQRMMMMQRQQRMMMQGGGRGGGYGGRGGYGGGGRGGGHSRGRGGFRR